MEFLLRLEQEGFPSDLGFNWYISVTHYPRRFLDIFGYLHCERPELEHRRSTTSIIGGAKNKPIKLKDYLQKVARSSHKLQADY
jgi:hypothetical protein